MFRFYFILIAMLALWATVSAICQAPEGYQDETGFHYHRAAS
jgi:hypothetical protein